MHINQHLILLRGLPGAGKSTFAKLISENGKYPVFSVDDYFTDHLGRYQFIYSENHLAYAQCQSLTERAIQQGLEKIIVHNTFTMRWELEPYFNLAKKYHCKLFVLTVENYHQNKNIHDIPQEHLVKMADKYEVKLF